MTDVEQPPQHSPRQRSAGVRATWGDAPIQAKAVIAGIFVNRLGGFVHAFLVLYMVQRGYGAVEAGAALGAHGAGSVAGMLLGGWLVDRFGARATIVWSMTATALLTAVIPLVTAYPVLMAVVTALGAASQIYRPASADVLSKSVGPERRVMAFAMYRLATNAGTTAAPLLGALLIAVSYRTLFWVEALAALGCVAVNMRTVPGRRDGPPQPADEPGGGPADVDGARDADVTGAPARYAEVLRDGRYLLFLLGMLIYSALYIQYVATLPLAVRDAGWSTFFYGVLVAVNGAIVITCELAVTKKVQHWPHRVAAVCGIGLVGAGVAAYALPFGMAGFVIATVVWSVGETVGSPTMVAYPAEAASRRLGSRYMAASQAVFGIGTALGPAAGSLVWGLAGTAMWPLCGALAVLAAAAAAAGMRGARAAVPG